MAPSNPQSVALAIPGQVDPLAVREPSTPVDPSGTTSPWERMVRETEAQWALFLTFRSMAYPEGPTGRFVPRSLVNLAQVVGVSVHYLREVSSSFQWYSRAGAYDRELERAKTEVDLAEVVRVRTRHLRMAAQARTWVETELAKLLARAQDPEIPTASAKEVLAAMTEVVKLERLLNGEHTESVQVEGAWDLESLTLEELEVLNELRKRAKGGG